MKKALAVIGYILLNAFLVVLSIYIFEKHILTLSRRTVSSISIESLTIVVIGIIGLILFTNKKAFRKVAVGVIPLAVVLLQAFIFYTNKSFPISSTYKTYKLRKAVSDNDHAILNIAFTKWANKTEIELNKCINVDSVQARVDEGFFLMNYFSNDIEIIESTNCPTLVKDTLKTINDYHRNGISLSKQRCFSQALAEFDKAISLNPKDNFSYFKRAEIFMVKEDYTSALRDLYATVLTLKTGEKSISEEDLNSLKILQEILVNNESNELALIEITNELNRRIEKGVPIMYVKNRIEFCLNKLKQ